MAKPTREEMEARLRQLAIERRLDPDFWAKVVEGESGWNPAARARTSKEDSGGLLQLNTKGGVGTEALKAGINPHDPEQWEANLAFGLDHAAKHGHRAWTVARQLKGEKTPGIPTNPVARGATKSNNNVAAADSGIPTVTTLPTTGLAGQTSDPWADMLAEREKEQRAQQLAAQAAQAAVAPPPQPSAPPPPMPAAPPIDYSALLMPRLRRGLLAEQGYGLLA